MAYEYNEYLKKINAMLRDDPLFAEFYENVDKGESDFRIVQRVNKKLFDLEWVDVIEECLVPLDEIVRNPRKFIVVEEDIIDISLARSISVESVRHLAQHTNLIAMVDEKKGTVTPSKILNTSKEESYEVYENRFIYTLLNKVNQFINTRYDAIIKAMNQSDQIQVLIASRYNIGSKKMQFKLDTIARMSFDDLMEMNSEGLTPVERVLRMRQIVTGYLNSAFAKSMVSSAPVRPPITRTNVIKKNPNYKKALELWQFVESYNKKGFEVKSVLESRKMEGHLLDDYKGIMFLNNLILHNMSSKELIETPPFDTPLEIVQPYDLTDDIRGNLKTDKLVLNLEKKTGEYLNAIRDRLQKELLAALKNKKSLAYMFNQNLFSSMEMIKMDELKRKYKINLLKLIDEVFNDFFIQLLEESANMDYALERSKKIE